MKSRIGTDLMATAKMFVRNKGAMFWTLAFPIFLIVIFGAIFSSTGTGSYTLNVQNLDHGPLSQSFMDSLNQTGVVKIVMVDPSADPDTYIKDNSVTNFMIIPGNFTQNIALNSTATIELRQDRTQSAANIMASVVGQVVNHYNLNLSGGKEHIAIHSGSIVTNNLTFLDFFLPGVIGLTAMTNCVFYMQGVQSRYFATGIFRKLSTTPFTRFEWLISRALWQTVVVFMSVAAILIVGMLFFNVHITLTWMSIVLIIVGGLMFTGLGMILSRFAKDEETANAAASAVTFPMMFLGGSFFDLSASPEWLQMVASIMPLTYMNNGLRDTMIYGNDAAALFNLGILAVVAVVFVVIGVYVSKWTDD
ncbi:MAG: ABC-2 family transporter protein [Methanomassiliicoccales archaeon PtaU1.Bin124]|nr:MAG: ABC-2 family transporter protein [Methanomassiliicoccales archaeon PtaU1.Bin124]